MTAAKKNRAGAGTSPLGSFPTPRGPTFASAKKPGGDLPGFLASACLLSETTRSACQFAIREGIGRAGLLNKPPASFLVPLQMPVRRRCCCSTARPHAAAFDAASPRRDQIRSLRIDPVSSMGIKSLTFILLMASTSGGQAQRAAIVPADWVQEDRASASTPLRYVSPDGAAWISLHASPADRRATSMKVSVRSGEQVTYKRVTPRFVAVSGFRGDRIFYRKSNLACRGTRWHHIALEYPAADKRKMDGMVTRAAHGMNRYDGDCKGSGSTTSGGLVRNH